MKTVRFQKPRTEDWEEQEKRRKIPLQICDAAGKPKSVYLWKLVVTDKVPAGKRDCIAVRDKELSVYACKSTHNKSNQAETSLP